MHRTLDGGVCRQLCHMPDHVCSWARAGRGHIAPSAKYPIRTIGMNTDRPVEIISDAWRLAERFRRGIGDGIGKIGRHPDRRTTAYLIECPAEFDPDGRTI